MNDHKAIMEDRIREKVRDIANEIRRRADEFDRIAEYKNVEEIPALVSQAITNLLLNARIDLPAVWLGELVKLERAENKN